MNKAKYIIFLLCLVGVGCINKDDLAIKNLKVDSWTPDWAFPFMNSQLSLKNLIKNGDNGNIITEDATGLFSLHYEGKVFTARASDVIQIPDQHFNTPPITLNTPIDNLSFTGTVADTFDNHFGYTDTSGAHLWHIGLKAGTISMNISSGFQQNMSLQVIFPSIKNNGTPLQINVSLTYPSTTGTASVDLSNYVIDMTNGGTTNNYLSYRIICNITGSGQPIHGSDNFNASVNLSNLKYSFVDGGLGVYNFPIPYDSIPIGVFNNMLTANIFLKNPKIHLGISSSFGLSASAVFDSLYGLTNKGEILPVGGAFFTNPIVINGPTVIGQTAVTNLTIDSTNSTVQNVFNPAPNKIIYKGKVSINSASSTYNFITDTSSISLTVDAELPAWFKIINFALQDTLPVTLPPDTNLLQKAQFRVIVTNGFPLYTSIQLYFADSNHVVLDSLIQTSNDFIPQAPVDANGIVTGTTSSTTDFEIDHDRYQKFASKVKYGFLRGNLKSSGSNSVQIRSSNNIGIKLALRLVLNISKI